ncbi:MAG: hypothetical protein ACPG80_01615, partial [Rickettsiales bacterium]
RITGWFLRNYPQPINLSKAMADYEPGIREFVALANGIASDAVQTASQHKRERFIQAGVPEKIAQQVAELESMASACDVVRVASNSKLSVRTVGQIYFEIGHRLRLGWLRMASEQMTIESHWDRIAVTSISNDLYDEQRRLTQTVISNMNKKDDAKTAVEKWVNHYASSLERLTHFMSDLETAETLDFSMLVVAMRNIESICDDETCAVA